MKKHLTIGLVGDQNSAVPAHRAIPLALQRAGELLGLDVHHAWIPTEEITTTARLAGHDGLWCVPASPYRSMDGALLAIRHARERNVPFLGTCGGFQHAVIEYARHVLGWADAEHAESSPGVGRSVIAPLACGLLESAGAVRLLPGTRLAAAYEASEAVEGYQCRYGLNPAFRDALVNGPLRGSAVDEDGDLRAVELYDHPFFVATLFQPERAALRGESAPLVVSFVKACAQ